MDESRIGQYSISVTTYPIMALVESYRLISSHKIIKIIMLDQVHHFGNRESQATILIIMP